MVYNIYIYIMVIWLYHMILPINHHESHCLLHPIIFEKSMYFFPFTINPRGYLEISPAITSWKPQGRAVHLSAAACHRWTPSTWGAESQTRAAVLRTMVFWWFCQGIFMGNFTCKLGSFSEVWWNVMKYAKISFRLWNSQNLVETNLEKTLFGRVYVNLLEGVIGLICRTKKIECFQCSLKHKFSVFKFYRHTHWT